MLQPQAIHAFYFLFSFQYCISLDLTTKKYSFFFSSGIFQAFREEEDGGGGGGGKKTKEENFD